MVSGDLRNHPVGYFLEGVLSQLYSSSIELLAFSTSPKSDELTLRIKPYFKDWVSVYGLSDDQAAQAIHETAPHILIDLSGHTAHNRLQVFAYKPALVQVTWLGYFSTTGVAAMDYILAGPHLVPKDEENHFVEKVWRLPETSICFTSPDVQVDVSKLPALDNGFITFGCFNNLSKMNEQVVSVWSRILERVPGSILFLKTKQLADAAVIAEVIAAFGANGISENRLVLEGRSPRDEYFAAYHRVDIALDPFPFPGGTTSAEALWMGVPVLTLKGDRFISHQGESIAHNVGMSDWITEDSEDYLAKAQYFASDVQSLARLRSGLREQVLKSPLFDAKRFVKHFESAMWGMWAEYKRTLGSPSRP